MISPTPWTVRGLSILDAEGNRIGRAEISFGSTSAQAESNAKLMAQGPTLVTQIATERNIFDARLEAMQAKLDENATALSRCGPTAFDNYLEIERLRESLAATKDDLKFVWAKLSRVMKKKNATIAELSFVVRGFREALTRLVAAPNPSKEVAHDALMFYGLTDDYDVNTVEEDD